MTVQIEMTLEGRASGAADIAERTSEHLEVESLLLDAGTHYDLHYHSKDQLAWMGAGSMSVAVGGSVWHLRREHLVWIPAGMLHEMTILDDGELINVYADTRMRPAGQHWSRPCVAGVDRLMPALLYHLSEELRGLSRQDLCHRLIVDVLEATEPRHDVVAVPTDERARVVARALMTNPADPRELADFAAEIGVSARTLTRVFRAQTGLTFRQWRALVRLNASADLLARGQAVCEVADAVGYATTSGFVAAFAARFGHTPGRYAQVGAAPREALDDRA